MISHGPVSLYESEIGKFIRVHRKDQKLSQSDLAVRAGLSLSAIKALEKGSGSTLSTLISTFKALNLQNNISLLLAQTPTISPMAMLLERQAAEAKKLAARK